MKKEIKTPKTKAKKVTKLVIDYKGLYESMKTLTDNLSEELNYKADLAFDRGAVIDKLNEKVTETRSELIFWAIGTFILGVAVGLIF